MTVQEIKAAIPLLTMEERAEIAACLNMWEDDEWDLQMKRDAAAGKFDQLHRNADAEHAAGKTVPLDDILRQP